MSKRSERFLALAAAKYADQDLGDIRAAYRRTLEEGMHGICFSPYTTNQKPGDMITEEQIRRRMEIIKPYVKWIRSFSCTDGNELIPRIAHEYGIKTLVGAWLGKDDSINKREVENLIRIANEGIVDIAAVGNEVMYRKDLSEEELLRYIRQVKESIPDIPVGYVDAYYEFADRPQITGTCDVILANCYPFWEGCDCDYSLLYMKEMYNMARDAGAGKKVIITETGWPSEGTDLLGAHPSEENFMKYFINTQQWSRNDDIDIFYFSSFDEAWKTGAEGDVGACWGIWDENEKMKF